MSGCRSMLLLPLLLACAPGDRGAGPMEPPAPMQPPLPTRQLEVPDRYHGLWVSDPDICRHRGDLGQRILIGANRVDHMNVTVVQVYAGGGPVFVHLEDDEGHAWELSLKLVSSLQRLQVRSKATGFDAELLRCPEPSSLERSRTSASTSVDGQR